MEFHRFVKDFLRVSWIFIDVHRCSAHKHTHSPPSLKMFVQVWWICKVEHGNNVFLWPVRGTWADVFMECAVLAIRHGLRGQDIRAIFSHTLEVFCPKIFHLIK